MLNAQCGHCNLTIDAPFGGYRHLRTVLSTLLYTSFTQHPAPRKKLCIKLQSDLLKFRIMG